MSDVLNGDVKLHVEVDGEGDPVTVLAHGLTNSCRELAVYTPLVPGTKVRFCFRGHGHSSSPASGYRFADFASDVDVVAREHHATVAVGTSLGAGAIMNLLERHPDRFERLVFLLPSGLDRPFLNPEGFLDAADRLERMPKEEVIEAFLSNPDRVAAYAEVPWLRDVDRAMWEDLDPEGLSRAIREVCSDHPVSDRAVLARVVAPTLVVCREGDAVHPAAVGKILAELMPSCELVAFADQSEMIASIPVLVQRVGDFLGGG